LTDFHKNCPVGAVLIYTDRWTGRWTHGQKWGM